MKFVQYRVGRYANWNPTGRGVFYLSPESMPGFAMGPSDCTLMIPRAYDDQDD